MADLKPFSKLELRTKDDYVAKNHIDETASAPTAAEDYEDGFGYGSIWIDVVNGKAYICLDPQSGAAVWSQIT